MGPLHRMLSHIGVQGCLSWILFVPVRLCLADQFFCSWNPPQKQWPTTALMRSMLCRQWGHNSVNAIHVVSAMGGCGWSAVVVVVGVVGVVVCCALLCCVVLWCGVLCCVYVVFVLWCVVLCWVGLLYCVVCWCGWAFGLWPLCLCAFLSFGL